jgi:hypothetical protein
MSINQGIIMKLSSRIDTLKILGEYLKQDGELLNAYIQRTFHNNLWFTPENQRKAIKAIINEFLNAEKLTKWAAFYDIPTTTKPKSVGLVMAGNIPLVGFHDMVCLFVAGHKALIKLSDKDRFLLPHLLEVMKNVAPEIASYYEIVEKLMDFDAVIATGSNNSARYFEAYFGKYPHIIRKNRNGVAVLTGNESKDELHRLGKDIFRFFGLGCRNVSKIYVPEGYDFQPLLEALHKYHEIVLHDKYKNNFDYNLALVLLNGTIHFNNGCIILVENDMIPSRIAMLHYSFYADSYQIESELKSRQDQIQCIISTPGLLDMATIDFGQSQSPALFDYPDGEDVMRFLNNL